MTPTKEQRAMMAAHLCDRMAAALRSGDNYDCASLISRIVADDGAEKCYRFGLGCYGVLGVEVDAAVAAIARGDHPAASLPGQLAAFRLKSTAGKTFNADHGEREGSAFWEGYGAALGKMLDLLGCKVTP